MTTDLIDVDELYKRALRNVKTVTMKIIRDEKIHEMENREKLKAYNKAHYIPKTEPSGKHGKHAMPRTQRSLKPG